MYTTPSHYFLSSMSHFKVLEGSDAADQAEGVQDIQWLLDCLEKQSGGGAVANFEFCQGLMQLVLQVGPVSSGSHLGLEDSHLTPQNLKSHSIALKPEPRSPVHMLIDRVHLPSPRRCTAIRSWPTPRWWPGPGGCRRR